MGKKHVVTQSQEELIKEGEKIESKVQKEVKETSHRLKEGSIYIFSSYNNTIMTLADPKGNVLHWNRPVRWDSKVRKNPPLLQPVKWLKPWSRLPRKWVLRR